MTRAALLGVLGLVFLPGMASAACSLDAAAPAIPDGKKASEADMLAAQGQVKAFNAAVTAFQTCLEKEEADAKSAGTDNSSTKAARTKRYNEAADAVQAAGKAFNEQVRAFKSK
jgi:hypothetical protein